MHKPGTPWPVATRVSFIVAFEELRRQHPHLSARRFCEATEVPYPSFARWWAGWRREGKARPPRPSKTPTSRPSALQGRVVDIIRQAHRQLGLGVRRLHVHLTPGRPSSPAA